MNFPSPGVIKITHVCEKIIQEMSKNEKIFTEKNVLNKIVTSVMGNVLEQSPNVFESCHKYELARKVATCYITIRLKKECKRKNLDIKKNRIRQKYNKVVLFQHQ